MWVYDHKHGPVGEILSEKAQVVILGNYQGALDFGKTYSAIAHTNSICIIFVYAASQCWYIYTFNVKTAFLNANLHEEVYCTQIPHFPEPDKGTILWLCKALYSLCQAGNAWYHTFRPVLEKFGLCYCKVDHGIFFGSWQTSPHLSVPMPSDSRPLHMLLPIHVDDRAVATNSLPLYAYFIHFLNDHFTVNDLGPICLYLGVTVKYGHEWGSLSLSQTLFIDELLDLHHLLTA